MVKELTPTSGAHRAGGRILDVLEHLAQGGQTLTLADLSHRLGVPKSSMLPLLRTLLLLACNVGHGGLISRRSRDPLGDSEKNVL